jgi:hypothetical protein
MAQMHAYALPRDPEDRCGSLPSGFWSAERVRTLRTLSFAGECLEAVAAEIGCSWEQIHNACSAHRIPRPPRRRPLELDRQREHAAALRIAKPAPGSFAARAIAAPTLAEAENRRRRLAIEEARAAKACRLGTIEDGPDEGADDTIAAIEAEEARRRSVEERAWAQIRAWQAEGITPIEACRRLNVLHNRNWQVVLHHLVEKLRQEMRPC